MRVGRGRPLFANKSPHINGKATRTGRNVRLSLVRKHTRRASYYYNVRFYLITLYELSTHKTALSLSHTLKIYTHIYHTPAYTYSMAETRDRKRQINAANEISHLTVYRISSRARVYYKLKQMFNSWKFSQTRGDL